MHTIIVVNGLGGERKPLEWAMKSWVKYGFNAVIFHVDWRDRQNSFETILNKLLEKIDSALPQGAKISLVGCSAGASLVLNAFLERSTKIAHVINICGPVRKEQVRWFKLRSIDWWKDVSPLLMQSLDRLQPRLDTLPAAEASKVMTIRAGFGDELVPPETVIIPSATNIKIIATEHTLAIYTALTLYKRKLIDFLNQ